MASFRTKLIFGVSLISLFLNYNVHSQVSLTGDLKQYHKTTFTFNGLNLTEAPSTYLNYRMNVTITAPSSQIYTVPAYFAADGNAAETSATNGNKWRCHFTPKEVGDYTYSVSFRTGTNIATSVNPTAGNAISIDGLTGTFTISATDKTGDDFRAKGKLQYVNEPVAQFDNGDYYYEVGADSPETFLEYGDFDATPGRHDYAEVAANYNPGDPSWDGGKGTEIIAAVNYLANQEMNVHYIIVNNITGDGNGAYPFPDRASYTTYDVSKLDQWQIVFDHMYNKGIAIEMVLSETENSNWFENQEGMDANEFSDARKLYYREMIARFGYLNVIYNIGEEANWDSGGDEFTAELIEEAAIYINNLTPYNDLVSIHNGPSNDFSIYSELFDLPGTTAITAVSLQGNYNNFNHGHNRIRTIKRNAEADGRVIVARYSEPYSPTLPDVETWTNNALWSSITVGAAGIHYYSHNGDIDEDDYTLYTSFYQRMAYAKAFIENNNIPIWEMEKDVGGIETDGEGYLLSNDSDYFVAFLPSGGTATVNLDDDGNTYTITWFNPREGGMLQDGSITNVASGDDVAIGFAPEDESSSWVVFIKKDDIPVAGIEITPQLSQIPVNETTQLYAFFNPENATNQDILWTSDNEAIATVDTNGLVTGIAEGTVTITATTADGGFSDDATFTIPQSNVSSNNPQYEEIENIVVIEAENIYNTSSWTIETTDTGFSGSGYLKWGINESFSEPGNGLFSVKIQINDPGIYLFEWRSKIGEGVSPTDENDSWVRFPDASDNFATTDGVDGSRIYPYGSGKTPNPNGSGKDNWWKVYTNTLGWNWQTRTSDEDPHDMYVQFDDAGVYTIEISARSKFHFIDRVVLSKGVSDRRSLSYNETLVDEDLLGNEYVNDSNNLKIFPNPANSSQHISLTGVDNDFYTIKLFDMVGKLIHEKHKEFKHTVETLHIPHLKSGMYFVSLINRAQNSQTVKLVIK